MNTMQRVLEETLFRSNTDMLGIYQLSRSDQLDDYRYMRMEQLESNGLMVHRGHYLLMYVAELNPADTLGTIIGNFNPPNRPQDFFGHSVSIGDVIVLQRGGEITAYYVDGLVGTEEPFVELDDFIRPIDNNPPISIFMEGVPTGADEAIPGYVLVNGTVLLDADLDDSKQFYTNGYGKDGNRTGLHYYPFFLADELTGFSALPKVVDEGE